MKKIILVVFIFAFGFTNAQDFKGHASGTFGILNATDIDATANKVFYSDNSGDVKEVSLGQSGTVLKSNGINAAPSFSILNNIEYQIYFPEIESPIIISAPYQMAIMSIYSIAIDSYEISLDGGAYTVPVFPLLIADGSYIQIKVTAFAIGFTSGDLTIFANKD
jgi:hypothetical protein